jgi:glycosyltransferase involved in cell wall biosynthesis
MRIVHVEAGRHLYGGAVQVRYLVDGLARAGVDNVLICAAGSELAAEPSAATVVTLPMRGDLDIGLSLKLASTLRREVPDLVHVHSRRGADLYGGLAAGWCGVPAVLTRRVDTAERDWFARGKYRRYDAVVALSAAIERQVRAAGVAAPHVVRIPSAVDPVRFAPDPRARARLRAAFDLPDDALVVGVVAQLIPRKRHAWLFAVLPGLIREFAALRVVCFGRGSLETELISEMHRRGLANRVTFAGFRNDLPALLPGLDLLAHPAEREGLGVALLEASAAGVPVVACAAGGVPDVVANESTGLLVPIDDRAAFAAGLARLLRAPAERVRFGAAARASVEQRHSVAGLVTAHLALYRRVLDERAAVRAAMVTR